MEKAGGFLKRKGMERWRKAGPEQYSTTGRSRVRVRGDGVLLPGRLASSALGAKTRRKAEEARPLDWIGRVLPQPPGFPVPAPTLWRTLACATVARTAACASVAFAISCLLPWITTATDGLKVILTFLACFCPRSCLSGANITD
jgi:hypothetical protein